MLAMTCSASAAATEAAEQENAAAIYREAFAALPHEEEDGQMYARWNSGTPMHQVAAELMRRCQGAFDLLHRATSIEKCDWGNSLPDADVDAAKAMGDAAALHVRSLFEQKRALEAADALRDLLMFGRRVAGAPKSSARVAGLRIEESGYVVAGRYLPGQPRQVLERLTAATEGLPPLSPPGANDAEVRLTDARAQAKRALFAAAVTVVRNGRGALKSIKDPFGDGPFTWDGLVDGFQLSSRLTDHGTHVALKCGPQAFE